MISLTRLNHQELILNCDLIKSIEQLHDTVITLVSGEKLTVMEPPTEILQRILAYRHAEGSAQSHPVVVLHDADPEDSHGPQ